MIRAIARYCSYRDRAEFMEADLRAVIVPDSVEGPGAGSVSADTTSLLEEYGLASRDGDVIRLSDSLLTGLAADQQSLFRRALREVVLDTLHNSNLWTVSKGKWSADGSREFTRIAAWFLDTPIEEAYGQNMYARSRKELTEARKLIENEEQWRVFTRWSNAIGLSSTLFSQDLPDPTVAVSDELETVCGEAHKLPIREFRGQRL